MAQYDEWFIFQLKELIDAVGSADPARDIIVAKYAEVKRGIQYSRDQPDTISDILIRMAQGLTGPIIVKYKLDQSMDQVSEERPDLDELQEVLQSRKKNKIVRKMSGSLQSLRDFEE